MKSLLFEFTRAYLTEAKVDVLKQKFPRHAAALDRVNRVHPKYLEWAARQLESGVNDNDLIPTLQAFHKNSERFKKRDITAYVNLKELEDAVKALVPSKRKTKEAVKFEGAEKIYDDNRYTVLFIKNKDASMCYGAGTQWCITMRDASYFEEYTSRGVIFYFVIDRTLKPDNPMSKVAFAIYRDDDLRVTQHEIYDAIDNKIELDSSYDKFWRVIKQDAPLRPESDLQVKLRTLRTKIKEGRASDEEIVNFVYEADNFEQSSYIIEQIENEGLKKYPLAFFQTISKITNHSDWVRVGIDGLKVYGDFESIVDVAISPTQNYVRVRAVSALPEKYFEALLRALPQDNSGVQDSALDNMFHMLFLRLQSKEAVEKMLQFNQHPTAVANAKRRLDAFTSEEKLRQEIRANYDKRYR